MSAIGLPRDRGFAVSAYADYRHDHLVFARTQSETLKGMDWEGRIQPLHSWMSLLLRGTAIAILATAMLAIFI